MSTEQRRSSPTARLARLGFDEPDADQRCLRQLGWYEDNDVVSSLAEAPSPSLALHAIARIAEVSEDDPRRADARAFIETFGADPELRKRACAVIGLSSAMGEYVLRHPEHWPALMPSAPDGESGESMAWTRGAAVQGLVDAVDVSERPSGLSGEQLSRAHMSLRVAYRRQLLGVVARDLNSDQSLESTMQQLSDLADGVLEAALRIARASLAEGSEPCRFAVIAMGKCGGRELNYISDVDVIFVAEAEPGGDETAALRSATEMAKRLIQAAGASTSEGSIWEVDAALRPEGKNGALVRTLRSHVAYYERWAKTWEFQALLKARPAAGDPELGRAYVESMSPMVWQAATRPDFVKDVQSMRRRVEEHIPSDEAERQLKLGAGGLRDVEFSVQLLQLVHGKSDVMLRSGNTLEALEALSVWGYVGRGDSSSMGAAYRRLRELEHRIQLLQLTRTHLLPKDEAALRRLGRSIYRESRDPVAALDDQLRKDRRTVRALHEKLFYRPLLNAVAQLGPDEARLSLEAAEERLDALGYTDPAGALRHMEALTSGVSRRAAIQRTLLPVMLGWFADSPDPDAGLLAFRRVSESLGSTPWYLRLLRDESVTAERLADLLGTSRYATDLLLRSPDAVQMIGDTDALRPRTAEALRREAASAVKRHGEAEAVRSVRGNRRRELLRIAAADLQRMLGVREVGRAISDVMDATLEGALRAVITEAYPDPEKLPMSLAIIGMGRLGGHESGYPSDADVMFVHEPKPGVDERQASSAALTVVTRLREVLQIPSPDPPLGVDADLRPEGKQGPLVRSFTSYQAYYQRWAATWEAQALLRARHIAGDEVGGEDLGRRFIEHIDAIRYPQEFTAEQVLEVRRLKVRMETERMPRGGDPKTHLKLGRGGLSDVEWVAQLLQLQNAHDVPGLRVTSTLDALDAAVAAGLMDDSDHDVLVTAWTMATRIRNANVLVTGRASDQVQVDPRVVAGVTHILGYPDEDRGKLLEDYLRHTRRARGVVQRLFYGVED